MRKPKNPNRWLILAFLITLLSIMFIIVKHHHEIDDLQEKIDNHSEIKDTV